MAVLCCMDPLGSIGTSHPVGTVLLPLPTDLGTHQGWVRAKQPGVTSGRASVSSASQQAIHHQILTRFHQTATPDIWCIAWGALALILRSQWGIEGNVFVLWRCSVTCHGGQGGTAGQPNSYQLFPWHHPVKRTKARILVSEWILLPALQHLKYLSC